MKDKRQPTVRVILVTGASSGIGRACAEHLAACGHQVYGSSRQAAPPSPPAGVRMLRMDVTDAASVEAAVAAVRAASGRIDVLINNAGDGIAGAVEDTPVEEARRQFETNFFGLLRVCHAVLPLMRAQGDGLIVNLSSLGGLVGLPFQGLYSASKFAVEGLSEALRMEVAPFGVRVLLIEPGDFRTGFTAQRRALPPSAAYASRFKAAMAAIERDEMAGADPRQIARRIERLLTVPAPPLRHRVGALLQCFAVGILRPLLPQRRFERLMMNSYGI